MSPDACFEGNDGEFVSHFGSIKQFYFLSGNDGDVCSHLFQIQLFLIPSELLRRLVVPLLMLLDSLWLSARVAASCPQWNGQHQSHNDGRPSCTTMRYNMGGPQ